VRTKAGRAGPPASPEGGGAERTNRGSLTAELGFFALENDRRPGLIASSTLPADDVGVVR